MAQTAPPEIWLGVSVLFVLAGGASGRQAISALAGVTLFIYAAIRAVEVIR